MLRFTGMILILSAYNCRQEFCQNLWKVQILDHYIIDAFRLLSPSSQLLRMILVNPDTNVIFEAFPWLKVNRHCNTQLCCSWEWSCAVQLFSSHKSKFIFEILLKCISWKLLTSIIIIIVIVNLFAVDKNRFYII